ncbi:MAG: HAMP domain-containing sensor histidine kinase [Bacteroidota bacterium]
MKRFKSYYNRLNGLAFGIFVLLVLLQSIWLSNAAVLQQKEQKLQLKQIIPDLALEINQIGRSFFHQDHFTLPDTLFDQINQAIRGNLEANGIDITTFFSIFMEEDTSLFFSNNKAVKAQLLQSSVKSCLSCIQSFMIVEGEESERRAGESDEAFSERLNQHASFQYYAPVKHLVKEHMIWLSLYQPHSFSNALQSMIGLFVINILLLLTLLYLFNHLQQLLANSKQLAQIKEDFFNNMTHEFKTPLSSIRLASRVLRQNKNPAKHHTYFDLIEKESKTLENQIDKLLQLSLLDHRDLELDCKSIDLHHIIQEIPNRLKPLLEEYQGTLNIQLSMEDSMVRGDAHHLSNSLCNLVENSLKYAEKAVNIWINTYTVNQEKVIIVRDDGPGIRTEYQTRIFERFYRAKKQNEYKNKGFGIGLSYVKMIIEAHQGKVTYNAAYTEGCEFIIKL